MPLLPRRAWVPVRRVATVIGPRLWRLNSQCGNGKNRLDKIRARQGDPNGV